MIRSLLKISIPQIGKTKKNVCSNWLKYWIKLWKKSAIVIWEEINQPNYRQKKKIKLDAPQNCETMLFICQTKNKKLSL